ncbi:MAG: hypothetical protein K8T91_22120, partial [Planctomycetes bacterium]|nr:hypothetical protein [Planctomycetota bacterium]
MKSGNTPPRPQNPNIKGGMPPRPTAENAAVKKAQPLAVPVRPGPTPREQARQPQRPTGAATSATA